MPSRWMSGRTPWRSSPLRSDARCPGDLRGAKVLRRYALAMTSAAAELDAPFALTRDQIRRYAEDGFVKLRGVLSPAAVSRVSSRYRADLRSERCETVRKLMVIEFVTLDGVMQGLGSPDEDRDGGFDHGGWAAPFFDEVQGAAAVEGLKSTTAYLFGRKTYEHMAAYW